MSNFQSIRKEYRNADFIASGLPISEFRTVRDMEKSRDRTDFGERLAQARVHAGLTQTTLAKKVGISQSTIAGLEREGKGSSRTTQLAAALCVNAQWLATGAGNMLDTASARPADAIVMNPSKVRHVYVVGRGNGGAMPERIWTDGDYPVGATDACAEIATNDAEAFLVEVQGTSMVNRYHPGEFALVEPGTEPELEDDVLVRLATGETMIKRLLSRRAGWRFGSYNNQETLHFSVDEVSWVYYVAHPVPRRKIKSRC
ncbi:S24 family peptidase [uncultured Xylophilus sp.]|uniref:S24 family peptidase n=1 Tax=uncultured Xylophilus sp. TaxID=296832 RepID=UPI0025F887B3|nr:S24 family peptidase [uncultured Xylophilus sp.]